MHPGKILILIGLLLISVGLFWLWGIKLPFLGKLPGDFSFRKAGVTFYFPLTTCLLISLIVTFLLWLFRR
jgi:Protein of unknown function (DUF2905)